MSLIAPSGQETIAVRHAPRPPVPPTVPAVPAVPAVPPTAPALFAQVRVDANSLAQSRANALIIGDQLAVMRVLGIIWPTLKKSVRWVESTRLSLPLESGGTLILEEADQLSERDQTDLLAWLDEHGLSVRVVTTSSRPLFPLVEAGSFLDSLYYRLNHVVITAR
jgi:sigma-54-interacting transcriptional regulator